jgi:hypothetical protein
VKVQGRLAELAATSQVAHMDRARLARDLRQRLTDWQGLILKQPQQARQGLKKLLEGRLAFTPSEDGTTVEFSGQGRLDPILAGVTEAGPVPGRAASLRCAGWLRSVSTSTADRSPGASAGVPRLRGAKPLVGGGSPRSGRGRGVHQPARRVSGRGRWHVRPEPARDGQVPVETTLQRADASGHGVCSRRPAWLGRVPRPRLTSAAGPSRLCSTGPSRHTCRRSSGARREKTGPVDGRRSSDASSRPIRGPRGL